MKNLEKWKGLTSGTKRCRLSVGIDVGDLSLINGLHCPI